MHVHPLRLEHKDGRMPRLPDAQQNAQKCARWALGCGVGFAGVKVMLHGLDMPSLLAAIAAGTVSSVVITVGNALPRLVSTLPAIITERKAKKVAVTRAKLDSKVTQEGERRRDALAKAALGGNVEAQSLWSLQMLDDQMRAGRQFSEDMLRELLPRPRAGRSARADPKGPRHNGPCRRGGPACPHAGD